jgi:hypothetical protein
MPKLSPLVSEFRTLEEADSYDRWLRSKVIAALADRRPALAHDKVIAEAVRTLHGGIRP